MKKVLFASAIAVLLILLGGTALASDVSNALWRGTARVSNTGGTTQDGTVIMDLDTDSLISNGFANATATDMAIQYGGTDVAFMPGVSGDNWGIAVPVIGASQNIDYFLYTDGTTGGKIRYFPGADGMTTTDDSSLELDDDFQIEQKGFIDTSSGDDKNLVYKQGAFRSYISDDEEITSAILTPYGEAYPVVAATNGGNDTSDQGSHTVNLPANIASGNLLIAIFASDENPTITFPEGWTELFQDSYSTTITLGAWYRVADGTEESTVTVTTSTSQMTAHSTYRITGWFETPVCGTAATSSSANPNPPSLTPGWVAGNHLWIACCGYDDGTRVVSSYPSNYADNQRNDHANNASGCGAGIATRNLNATSDDPGTYILSASVGWVANTIAIAPPDSEALAVTATDISSDEYTIITRGVANDPQWATGDVLHFDGTANSYVDCGAINNASAKLWVAFWFMLDSSFAAGAPADLNLWGKKIDDSDKLYVYLKSSTGQIIFRKRASGVTKFELDGRYAGASITSWAADTWYFGIASISDVNGAQIRMLNSTTVTSSDTSAAPNGGNFVIGDAAAGDGTGIVGAMMNIIIGTDDLSGSEQTALYTGTAPGDETDYWYADEGTGTTIYSYGSGGNDGTAGTACAWQTKTYTSGETGRLCDFTLQIDSDRWGANLKDDSVSDSDDDWYFLQNSSMPYMEYHKITVADTLEQHIIWQYATTFTDQSEGGNDATPDFIDVSDPAELSAELISFSPVSQAKVGSFSLSGENEILTDVPEAIPELYTELEGFEHIPGAEAANELLEEGDIPQALWWFPFLFFAIGIIGFIVYGATKQTGAAGSLFTMCAVVEVLLAVFGIMNPIPFWPALLFPIPAAALILSQKHFSWG